MFIIFFTLYIFYCAYVLQIYSVRWIDYYRDVGRKYVSGWEKKEE